MIRLLVDEDFNNHILRAALRRSAEFDVVRAQDVGLSGRHDRDVLEWAARERRVVLTHDVRTMRKFATERLLAGRLMVGLFIVSRRAPKARVIDDLILIVECSVEGEWLGQIRHVPL